MSLFADLARTASTRNLALTLNWFAHELEKREANETAASRAAADGMLQMLFEHLSSLEKSRLQELDTARIDRERESEHRDALARARAELRAPLNPEGNP